MNHRNLLIILVIFFMNINFTGCFRIIHHNELRAISDANKFLFLICNRKYKDAYPLMHSNLREKVNFNRFRKDLERSFFEEYGDISQLIFSHYFPVLGKRAIQLFYTAYYGSGRKVILHLVLAGDAKKGYQILVLDFGNIMPYPPKTKHYGIEKLKITGKVIVKPDTIIITPEELREKIEIED